MTEEKLQNWLVRLCENATARLENDEIWQEIQAINEEENEGGELNIYDKSRTLELINENLKYEATDDDDKIQMMKSATSNIDADAELFSYFNQYNIRTATNYDFLHLIKYDGQPVFSNGIDEGSYYPVEFGSEKLNKLANKIVKSYWNKITADYKKSIIENSVDNIDKNLDNLEQSFIKENIGSQVVIDNKQVEKVRKTYNDLKVLIDDRIAELEDLKEKAEEYEDWKEDNINKVVWH